MANRYSIIFESLENWNSHSVFEFEGKIKFITVTKCLSLKCPSAKSGGAKDEKSGIRRTSFLPWGKSWLTLDKNWRHNNRSDDFAPTTTLPYSPHLIFFLTCVWVQKTRALDYNRRDRHAYKKHSSLISYKVTSVSYNENEDRGL